MIIEAIAITITALSAVLTAVLAFFVFKMRSEVGASPDESVVTERIDKMNADMVTERAVASAKLDDVDAQLKTLKQTVDHREGALKTQVEGLDMAVKNVVGLFGNDRRRGSWGELSLTRIFEIAGMVEERDYTLQFTAGDRRPDVLVHIPGGRTIVIDSKFPIARYVDALAEEDKNERNELFVAHGKELERTGKDLAKRHYDKESTADYVVMYLPSQAVYETAMMAHPEVMERLMKERIIVAGPNTVFGLIKTAGTLMAEAQGLSDAREILSAVGTVRDRLDKFAEHLGRVGDAINRAAASFNDAIGSWDRRLRPAINKTTDMARIDDVQGIDTVQTHITQSTPQELKEAS